MPILSLNSGYPPRRAATIIRSMDKKEEIIRQNLLAALTGEYAHMPFEEAVADFPMDRINDTLPNADVTPFHLLEHIRFSQEDILDFIRNPEYKEREWPKDYWPAKSKKATAAEWQKSIDGFKKDMKDLQDMVRDPDRDLYAVVPWGNGQTFVREIITASSHNGFHIGEFARTREAMGTWGKRQRS
jgi:hypothetical protein